MEDLQEKIQKIYDRLSKEKDKYGHENLKHSLKRGDAVFKVRDGYYLIAQQRHIIKDKSKLSPGIKMRYKEAEEFYDGTLRDHVNVVHYENGDIILKYDTGGGETLIRKDGVHIITTADIRYRGDNEYYLSGSSCHGAAERKRGYVKHTEKETILEYRDARGSGVSAKVPWNKEEKMLIIKNCTREHRKIE